MSTQPHYPVPHLTTALSGPLHLVEDRILAQKADIESWFRRQWRQIAAPLYASVDLRNAGFKLAPVDTNLFPAGFNNLNPAFEPLCIQAVQMAITRLATPVDRILLIPESHTRNLFYLENIAVLQQTIDKAGFEIRIGSLLPDLGENLNVKLESGSDLTLERIQRTGNRIGVSEYDPDLILLNNDLSGGRPDILMDIEQLIIPSPELGWSQRLKSVHFAFYRQVATEFAETIGLDRWLIDPLFRNCGEVDFMKREGQSCLAKNIDALIEEIQSKYDEYGVDKEPFVVVKADSGTYGMGVMMVRNSEDIVELNRKQRTRMSTTKEGQKVTKAIIQEGVYTQETWGESGDVAEPVIYMIDRSVVGGFYRVHKKRTDSENLNAPGMRFERLAFDDCCISPDKTRSAEAHPNRFYTYGVVGRLASLAAARECEHMIA